MGVPAYVISLDEASNTVVLGSREELMSRRLWAGKLNWLVDPIPTETFWAAVQIRYNHRGAPGKVTPIAGDQGIYDRVVVDFDQPVTAVTPGQAVVFYDDQIVLGGGWIEKSG
jgi:tRNA-specific 2-thiouridylase